MHLINSNILPIEDCLLCEFSNANGWQSKQGDAPTIEYNGNTELQIIDGNGWWGQYNRSWGWASWVLEFDCKLPNSSGYFGVQCETAEDNSRENCIVHNNGYWCEVTYVNNNDENMEIEYNCDEEYHSYKFVANETTLEVFVDENLVATLVDVGWVGESCCLMYYIQWSPAQTYIKNVRVKPYSSV